MGQVSRIAMGKCDSRGSIGSIFDSCLSNLVVNPIKHLLSRLAEMNARARPNSDC